MPTLQSLIYAKNAAHSLDLNQISEKKFEENAFQVINYLRNKKKRNHRGFVRRETLYERINDVRNRLTFSKKRDPRFALSRRNKRDISKEVDYLVKTNKFFSIHFERVKEKTLRSVTLGRSLELAKKLQEEGYYVFLHGQSLINGAVSDLITEVWRRKQTREFDPLHRKWRTEGSMRKWKNVAQYNRRGDLFNDHVHSNSILSVDGLFTRDQECESAFAYYWEARSICEEAIYSLFRGDAPQLLYKFQDQFACKARMNVIAIPKYLLQNKKTCFVYRSHTNGITCKCYDASYATFLQRLEEHQQGITGKCSSQYRILTYPLDLYEEIRTFTFDTLTESEKVNFENEKRKLLKFVN